MYSVRIKRFAVLCQLQPRRIRWIKRKYPSTWNITLKATSFLNSSASMAERVWYIIHNSAGVSCLECGSQVPFNKEQKVPRTFCSSRCTSKSDVTKHKKRVTSQQNHGVDNPLMLPEIQQQIATTNRRRYGVRNVSQSAKIKQHKIDKSIAKYGTSSPLASASVQSSIRATVRDRYDVDNISQVPHIQQKRRDTNIARRGVDNIRKTADYHDTYLPDRHITLDNIIQRSNIVHNNAYQYPTQSPPCGVHNKIRIVCATHGEFTQRVYTHIAGAGCPICSMSGGVSVAENEITQYIQSIYGGPVRTSDRSIISPKELDIVIPEINLAIEYNGLYWHGETQGKGRSYHIDKTTAAQSQRYQLIHINESEWMHKREIVMSRLATKIGVVTNRYHARKCTIQQISTYDANVFCNNNHIQGSAGCSVAYGLSIDGDLVCVLTMGKSRFDRGVEWELIRLCTKLHSTVAGGASRLLSRFIADHTPQSIITYSDIRWNTGEIYTRLGFTFSHRSTPSYHYFKPGSLTLYNRQQFQKHKLLKILTTFNPDNSEWENMRKNGYDRVWDCGNNVYRWLSCT